MNDNRGGYIITDYYERFVPSKKWHASIIRKIGNALTKFGLVVSQFGMKISHIGYDVEKIELRKPFEQFMRDYAKLRKEEAEKL